MRWSRRAVLRSGVAIIPALLLASGATAWAYSAGVLTLVLDGLPATAEASHVSRVLDGFLRRGLPIAVSIEAGPADAPVAETLMRRENGLLEVVATLLTVAGLTRYGQMRAAADHRTRLRSLLGDAAPVVTLLARSGEQDLDWSAFRSAGFRVLLAPDGSVSATAEPVGRGQLRLAGGASLATDAPLAKQVEDATSAGLSVLVLSLGDLEGPDAEALVQAVEQVADWLGDRVATGDLLMLRPVDHLLQSGEPVPREVALLLDLDTPAAVESAVALMPLLDDARIPFTLAGPDLALERLGRGADCRPWTDEALDGSGGAATAACLVAPASGAISDVVGARTVLAPAAEGGAWTGLHDDARLWASLEPWAPASSTQASAPLRDSVVRVDLGSLGSSQQRAAFVRELSDAAANGGARFWTIAEWADYLVAPDPLLVRFWDARRRLVTDPPQPVVLQEPDREELLRDARAAWRYIERRTDPKSGLCVTTVEPGQQDQVNVEATLWDVGSQIQGILAAARLEIISWQDARDRIALLLPNVPTVQIDGLNLPPAIFRIDNLRPVRARDFDLCDFGRFLIALDSAVVHGALPQEQADRVIAQWDIGAALDGGRLHSLRNGRWHDITWSHCTDYIAPPLRRHGWTVESIFPEGTDQSTADQSMAILHAAAAAGSYGTEPGLLARIETDASEAERLLTLVLFDAQLSWYESHGELKSVSETPLNFPPWFSYQGLALEKSGRDAWVVNTLSNDPAYQTEEFRRRALLIGSKSAYLWKANYPHPYSDRLVEVVRDKCRDDDQGFAVGVFVSSLESMGAYFDINTNGIVLSAIAHQIEASASDR